MFSIVALLITNYCSAFTLQQWKSVRYILQHPSKTEEMDNALRQQIYNNYIPFAKKTCNEIKTKLLTYGSISYDRCFELNMYPYIGLSKAVKNYHADKGSFHKYAKPYIISSVYRGVSDINSHRTLPHSYRISNQWKISNKQMYIASMKPMIYEGSSDWLSSMPSMRGPLPTEISHESCDRITRIELVKTLPATDQRIFHLRYNVYDMSRHRTLRSVAELMCYSETYVSERLMFIMKYLQTYDFNNLPGDTTSLVCNNL